LRKTPLCARRPKSKTSIMNNETLDKMKHMKLHGMARAFSASLESGKHVSYSADEFTSHLIENEWDERHNRKLDRSLRNARFRYKASIEQLSYDAERNLDRNQLMRLADCNFIKKKENLIITGSTGIGKSYVASALGHHACSLGYKVCYHQSTKLFSKLKLAKADGSYLKEIARIERTELLIIDDFGIQPLDAPSRTSLMEIMEDRHGKASTIFTAQVPVNKWFDLIGEQTIADAILDRLVHNSHRIEMKGESMRKNRKLAEEETHIDQ
jgi:DNA replication protein DnaC